MVKPNRPLGGKSRFAAGQTADPTLQRYLDDIRRSAPDGDWDELTLFNLYRKGNVGARQRLIAINMRFVVKVALEYRSCPMPLSDLISEGSIGLIQAVETFDTERGVKFISYAVWWIRSFITKAINEKGYLIRLPSNQYFRLRKALQAERFGGLPSEDLRLLQQMSQGCLSLNAPGKGEHAAPWSDVLPDTRAADPSLETEVALDANLTERMLSILSDREIRVLRKFFGLDNECPQTLKEVGDTLEISAERVRQIRKKALNKIRKDPASPDLRDRLASLMKRRPL